MSFKRPLWTSGEEKNNKRPRNVKPRRNLGYPSELGRLMTQRKRMRAVISNWDYFELPVASGDRFLFEIEVNCSNRLLIPTERAKRHLPRFNTSDTKGYNEPNILHLTIPQTKDWHMPIMHYDDEDAFMFTRLWPQFVKFHNLKASDKIRFYKPFLRLHTHHYVVAFKRSERYVTQVPEFRQKNFLCKIKMTAGDVGYKRLFIHNDDVIRHFPMFHIPKKSLMADIIKFTDTHNKDWYMDVMRYNSDFYVIIEGWDEFVKERNLKAKDVIKFYTPVQPSHLKHFLIECVKNKGKSNPTRSGSRKNEGNGKQGDCGEPSHRGRNKRKKIVIE
ncbi:uncharacterized protein LOC130761784 [Actinidia eriantha]|uniref:uncharacterized protein LOC130761784 n=1 Tax=Actinidia eriantha TaxID=165200 RepID=UPI00258FE747|nr:uncharacterized protein LOC130761784 [Actinidia eriantha]